MQYEHETEIAAPPERLWELTTEVERWPTFLDTVTTVERLDDGPFRVGSQARLKQPGQRPTVWTVTEMDAPRRFQWKAHTLGSEMVATHRIEPTATGTRNHLRLDLTGGPAWLTGRLFGPLFRKTLARENAAFTALAEGAEHAASPGS